MFFVHFICVLGVYICMCVFVYILFKFFYVLVHTFVYVMFPFLCILCFACILIILLHIFCFCFYICLYFCVYLLYVLFTFLRIFCLYFCLFTSPNSPNLAGSALMTSLAPLRTVNDPRKPGLFKLVLTRYNKHCYLSIHLVFSTREVWLTRKKCSKRKSKQLCYLSTPKRNGTKLQ